jgi:hypothetical protein
MALNPTISGPSNVCTNSLITYSAQIDKTQLTKIEWMCGGAGVFTANGTTNYIEANPSYSSAGTVKSQQIKWIGSNEQSWVQARFYWSYLGVISSTLATYYVNIGVINSPTSIIAGPICSSKSGTYPISCTAMSNSSSYTSDSYASPNYYNWKIISGNAIIQNGITTNPTNNLIVSTGTAPIVVSVRYITGCSNAVSSLYSVTINRATGAPQSEAVERIDDACAATYNFTADPLSVVQTSSSSTGPWGTMSSFNILYPKTKTIYVRTYNDCSASVPNSYKMTAPNNCGGMRAMNNNHNISNNTEIVLFPNPSNGQMQLNYTLEKAQQGELQITDMLGKKVSSYKLTEGENTLSINETELKCGIYLYRVVINNELVKADKLSIVH